MRKLAIAVALSTTVLAGPALARDGAWYVGGDFGAMIVEDVDLSFDPDGANRILSLDHDYGYDGALFVGYDFGAFRLEAEVAYKSAELEGYNSAVPGLPGFATGFIPGARDAGGGETNVLSGMINAMLDFGDDDGISGFVGGGAGIARVDFSNLRAFANQGPFLDDSDTNFAWQAIAGVRAALTPNIDVTLRYRFFNVENVDTVGFNGQDVEGRFRSHSLLGGITFNFGAPEIVVDDCVAPNYRDANGVCVTPPPPCPDGSARDANGQCPIVDPIVTCPPPPQSDGTTQVRQSQLSTCPRPPARPVGPFIIYFDWDVDELSATARARLDEVAQVYQQTGQAQVVLAGHADRSGSATYNVGLSQRRANNTRDYLASRGVPAGAMTTQAFGESRPAVETADGVREPDNRRVEITFGPGSGF
ncbi:MAG: OmpA family protein [Allosphingosinicella sp.]|uniref:OmpA family protein n=1 Tax=Allosphingosinicella sp. TaxID=2823234 RepID=UPI003943B677